jgi:chromatin remodeling complex protein RSC6
MQTRSGKTYTNASSSSLKENKPKEVINVNERTHDERLAALKTTLQDARTFERSITITSTHPDSSTIIRRPSGFRRPIGFTTPTKISDELAKFLGKPAGTEMARTDVSRLINTYIRVKNLQDPQNSRIINADSKLRKLLRLGKNDELTYFNLQKYMKHHFHRE